MATLQFELKDFFEKPPRLSTAAKEFIYDFSQRCVGRIVALARMLDVERLQGRHVRIFMQQMCVDPWTRLTRHGLQVQQLRVKSVSKILHRLHRTCAEGDEASPVDRRLVRKLSAALRAHGVKHSRDATTTLASAIAELCGIMLNSANALMDGRTMSRDDLRHYATCHRLSNGEHCVNASLIRFLHMLQRPMATAPTGETPKMVRFEL